MVMENPELSLQVLERLKALGLGLSCDDFGTGYSSLSYLRRLPFDTLKVDRSFLLAGLEDERGSVVLDAIILLAHDLGLQVVCEGVETEAQMHHLASLECDLVQGFLIGEPIDAQQVLEALGAPTRGAEGTESGIAALWYRLSRRKPGPGTSTLAGTRAGTGRRTAGPLVAVRLSPCTVGTTHRQASARNNRFHKPRRPLHHLNRFSTTSPPCASRTLNQWPLQSRALKTRRSKLKPLVARPSGRYVRCKLG